MGVVVSTPTRRRPRWTWIAFVLLLVVPVAEIAVIIGVGKIIGGWPTIALLLVESALGAYLVKREGRAAWAALQRALTGGRMPAGELSDAALVLVGGTLLLAPGFLTDVVGFFFVLPFTRPLARRLLTTVITRQLLASGPGVVLWGAGMPPRNPGPGQAPPTWQPGQPSAGQPGQPSAGQPRQQQPRRDGRDDDVIEGEIL